MLNQLAVAAAMQGPPHCHSYSLKCALWDLSSTLLQHSHELGPCGFIILLYLLFNHFPHFACQLERPTTHWEARNRSMRLVLMCSCPHSLLGYPKPFHGKDLCHPLAGSPPLKVELHNSLLAVRWQNHIEINWSPKISHLKRQTIINSRESHRYR